MHQKLAIILQQLCYGKISFVILVPGPGPVVSASASSISSTSFYPQIFSGTGYYSLIQRVTMLYRVVLDRYGDSAGYYRCD